jgi:hypothetical protein
MKLTPEQAEKAVQHLSNGSRIVESARMIEVSWSDFASAWTDGRTDSENGRDTDEAKFYRSAQAARARHCATKRGAAQQSALHRVDAYSGQVGGFLALRGGSHAIGGGRRAHIL